MNVMRNLALITIILLFLIIFNSISNIFTRNNCVASYIGIGSKKEMNKSDYYIIYSSLTPSACYLKHVNQNELNPKSFNGQYEDDNDLPAFHNTSETAIGYFLIQ